jgi:hypothetical protein
MSCNLRVMLSKEKNSMCTRLARPCMAENKLQEPGT